MTLPITDPRMYSDFAGLDQLKSAARANDPEALRAVARQFESLFARMMIKSMRDAVGKDPIFGSDQEQMYQGMFDDQLSVDLTKGRGLGLADMLIRQLQRMGVSGSGAVHAATGATDANDANGANGANGGGNAQSPNGTTATHARAGSPKSAVSRASSRQGASSAARSAFIRSIWPHAVDAARQLGVSPQSIAAQAALETDWGQQIPQDASGGSSHNLFGIKAGGNWPGSSVTSETQEYSGAIPHAASATFRAYDSPGQSFADYVALLRSEPRYAAALGTGDDVHAFAAALQRGGYATDPNYARKVSAVAASLPNLLSASAASSVRSAPDGQALKLADARPINVTARTL